MPLLRFQVLVFKIMADKHLGQLSFVRIYSGTIKAGSYAYNPSRIRRSASAVDADARQQARRH